MRRLVTTLTVKAVVLAGLPGLMGLTTATAARATSGLDSAELSATANLVEGRTVLPGTARQFAVEVSNTSSGALLGGGPSINYVNIILPSAAGVTTNPSVSAPSGWTVEITDAGSLQTVKFRSSDDSAIGPGDELVFPFPADVAAPASADQDGTFRVAVSSDGGRTTERADGELSTVVKVLEVVSLGAVAPPGVVDQTATSGMDISYQVRVRNYAREALSVTASLTSDRVGDMIEPADPATVASNETADFVFPVTLGMVTSGQRTSTFTGGATATGAEAVPEVAGLTVQAAPVLTLVADSFQPRFVRSNAPLRYEFSVAATKSNPPALTVEECVLSFADTSTGLADPVTFEGSESRTLTFDSTTVDGREGSYTVGVQCSGVDDNGVDHSYDLQLTDAITIDNAAPAVTVDVGIPDGQEAVKSGDEIEVTGTISEEATLDFVQLRTDRGQVIPCDATTSGGTFSCEVTPTFDEGTTAMVAEAQATDRAGNIGAGASPPVVVDLIAPEFAFAITRDEHHVLVRFDEEGVVRGGCDPSQWTVDGHAVSAVQFSDGSDCTSPPAPSGQTGPAGMPDNFRILELATTLDRDETPQVEYTRRSDTAPSDNAFDRAAHRAPTATVVAEPGILPPPPDLTQVTRSDTAGSGEREEATRDGPGTKEDTDTYWTNLGGDDLRASFAGGREGYRVQVVDGAGNPLTEPQEITSEAGQGTIAVPLGTDDGRYVRGIRLINAAGPGPATFFDVVLDRVDPHIADATADGEEVTVQFDDVLAFGSNFANDWYAYEVSDRGREYYQPERVDGERDVRILTVPFDDRGPFGGVEYLFTSDEAGLEGARRYEDRAGNLLADTTPAL